MLLLRMLLTMIAMPALAVPLARAGTDIRIDPAVSHGTWEGWGASLAWWGKVFGDRSDLADLFYTTKTVDIAGQSLPGLGFNIVRYNAGACSTNTLADGRRMVVSKTILPFRQIDAFWLDPRDPDPASSGWDWSVDTNQRAMLLMARDRGADRFELFANSPPWWMCKNDNPSGAAKATDDNLAPAHYADFARYLAAIARHARDDWGVTFTTVEAFNEPTTRWWHEDGKQEGCHVSVPEQQKILPLVRAALDAEGLQTIALSASDESLYDQAVAAWKAYAPAAKALVAQVNVHGYQGAKGDRAGLHRMVSADGKALWNSEYGGGDATGLELAKNLQHDFAQLHPTAWCYWQPIDGGRHGKGGSGWGLVDAEMNEGRVLHANNKLFVLAQYSRHIRPGMIILDSGDPRTVVAQDSTTRNLVIVTLNDTDAARLLNYNLTPFAATFADAAAWQTDFAGPARYRPLAVRLPVNAGHLTARIPAKSVMTFELTATDLTTFSSPERAAFNGLALAVITVQSH